MASAQNVITIDGPAASGKSSVSRELSRLLGWRWVSTGAFYRALGFVAESEGVALDNAADLVRLCGEALLWDVRLDADKTRVYYKDKDVTTIVMSEAAGGLASQISQIPEVRRALLANQRACANSGKGLVAEGRDCGSVVFPNAALKIYLTASQEERALRRAREQGLDVEHTLDQQHTRDTRDTQRSTAPLQIPDGARLVNSNGMDLEQVVQQIHAWAVEALSEA